MNINLALFARAFEIADGMMVVRGPGWEFEHEIEQIVFVWGAEFDADENPAPLNLRFFFVDAESKVILDAEYRDIEPEVSPLTLRSYVVCPLTWRPADDAIVGPYVMTVSWKGVTLSTVTMDLTRE